MKYQHLMEQMHIRPNRPLFNPHFGQVVINRAGESDDFLKYKPYSTGDSLHQIDWRRYAKEKKLYTSEFGDEGDFLMIIGLDTSRSMQTEDKSKIKSQESLVKAIAYNALYRNHSLVLIDLGTNALMPIEGISELGLGLAKVHQWLETRSYESDSLLLKSALHQDYKSAFFIMLSDCWSEDINTFIKQQKGLKNDFLCIRLLSAEEKIPQLNGYLMLKDAESKETIKLKVNSAILDQYTRLLKEDTLNIKKTCHQYGYRFFEWIASDDIKPLLISLGR